MTLLAATALLVGGCGGGGGQESEPEAEIPFDTSDWATDFETRSIDLDELVGGGPPKDGIPSIDDPAFVSVARADEFLDPREPVALVELGGETKAYPLQILIWHEIVNDELGGKPIAVTYCPLCNSTVAFERELDGEAVEFGTTGMLRNSDLVMYDRATESWWQQFTAEAIVGERTGAQLDVIPSQILSWRDVGDLHPEAEVLSRDTGFERDYGATPYASYDSDPDSQPFLLRGEADRTLPPKERVAAITTGDGGAVVYPYTRLKREAPVDDKIGDRRIVVFYDPNVASALDDARIADGRAVGSAGVFDRSVSGRTLDFEKGPEPGTFRDAQTGSTWGISGIAIAGRLEGTELERVPHDDQFWFALAAFFDNPDIRG